MTQSFRMARRRQRPAVTTLLGLMAFAWVSLLALAPAVQAQMSITDRPMPEFHNQDPKFWVNSPPLKTPALKGKVLLVEVWTSI